MKRRLALLALAAVAYTAAAWSVAPGFYDGFQPATPYRWVSPPPNLRSGNQTPLSGKGTDPVSNGETAPLTTYTGDGQVVVSFLPGAFRVTPGADKVTIQIKPVAQFPSPGSFQPVTNVYLITADAPLVKQASVQLTYSTGVPAPSSLYNAADESSPWKNLGASQFSQSFTISSKSSSLGYFAGGYPTNQSPPPSAVQVGGGQVIPIVVAGLILLVLLAGVPLALRRRGGDEDEPAEDG